MTIATASFFAPGSSAATWGVSKAFEYHPDANDYDKQTLLKEIKRSKQKLNAANSAK